MSYGGICLIGEGKKKKNIICLHKHQETTCSSSSCSLFKLRIEKKKPSTAYLKHQSNPISGVNCDGHARAEVPAIHNPENILLDLPHGERRVREACLEGRRRLSLEVLPLEFLAVLVSDQNLADQDPLFVFPRVPVGQITSLRRIPPFGRVRTRFFRSSQGQRSRAEE